MPTCLSVEDLHVRYGAVMAVRGLSLRLEAGEVVAVVGPNGAGKSSALLAIAGGASGATVSGSIAVDDERIERLAPEHRLRRGIALVPQGRRIFARLTVQENLVLSGLVERDRAARDRRIGETHELFPVLRDFAERPAGLLSGGQQQQLAIARALMSAPDFLLLDEPSLGLSPKVAEDVFAVVGALRERGIGVLLVEQNATRAVELATRAFVMTQGALRPLPVGVSADELRTAYFQAERQRVAT
jgi:branched-chain amino acid transport system ATP-binding protein